MATNVIVVVVIVGVLVVMGFSKFSVSQLIANKLRLLIGDNIPDFRRELDF